MINCSVMTSLVGTLFRLTARARQRGMVAQRPEPAKKLHYTWSNPSFLGRSLQHIWNSRRFSVNANQGYALPLVLVAIAVFLLYAGESAARVTREARVTKVKENSEMAFYAAEAGFNRARARLIKNAGNPQMMALNHRVDTLTLDNGEPGGTYELRITPDGTGGYNVVSTGTYGQPPFDAKRVVAGNIKASGAPVGVPPNQRTPVTTTYQP